MATSKYDFFTMNVTSLSISARFHVYELQKAMWFSQLYALSPSPIFYFLLKIRQFLNALCRQANY
jgi:hypothetical protein